MMYERGIQHYKKTAATSAGPVKIIVMIYDHLVLSINEARTAIEDNDIVRRNNCINKAQSIITELRNNLDFEVGGEIATNLDSLYSFMFRENLALLIDNDVSHIKTVLTTIEPIHEAWKKLSDPNQADKLQQSIDSGAIPATNVPEPVTS
ncbi:MAG: flagellar export chaperone FliS [bacterium]|nr:flagellar export chaperone FliS [bacterium]MCP4800718.1 flagellar export chaperone FliS [bacterium]